MSQVMFMRRALQGCALAFAASTLVASASFAAPYIVGALGDSMTRGFDSGAVLDQPEHSWSTGYDGIVRSHSARLTQMFGDVISYNVAVSGAKSWALPYQTVALLARARPDYVTILIGANDLCAWPDDDTTGRGKLENGVRRSVEMLVAANPAVKILVVPVPDMLQLREVGAANGCQLRWNITRFCPRLLGRSVTTQDLGSFASRLSDANESLADVAAAFPANVRFAADVARSVFSFDDVSKIDCFHPSVTGQDYLAEVTWRAGWFGDRN